MWKRVWAAVGVAGAGILGIDAASAESEPTIALPRDCAQPEIRLDAEPVSALPGGVAGRPSIHFDVGDESSLMSFVRRLTGAGAVELSLYDTVASVGPQAVASGGLGDLDPSGVRLNPKLEVPTLTVEPPGDTTVVGRLDPPDLDTPAVSLGPPIVLEPQIVLEPEIEMEPEILSLDPVLSLETPIDSTTSLDIPTLEVDEPRTTDVIPGNGRN